MLCSVDTTRTSTLTASTSTMSLLLASTVRDMCESASWGNRTVRLSCCLAFHELDLEVVAVGEETGVMVRSSGVGMKVREQQSPSVVGGVGDETVDFGCGTGVESEMVQSGAKSIMDIARERGGLFDHDVSVTEHPAAAVFPVLVLLVSKGFEEPADARDTSSQVWNPQLDVVQRPSSHVADGAVIHGPGVVGRGGGI